MCIQHKTLIINTIVLTKCRRWLLVMVCLFTLIPIKKIVSSNHNVIFVVRQKVHQIEYYVFGRKMDAL